MTAAPPTELTAKQRDVVDGLMARGIERPRFPPELAVELRDELEAGVADIAADLGPRELAINKHELAAVHACEQHFRAQREAGFSGWAPSTARGTVAHKAIELSVFLAEPLPPLELADLAIERLAESDDDWGPGEWLRSASPVERAELRGEVNDVVAKFLECFPPLSASWAPRLESRARVDLCLDRVTLRAKADLALGVAHGEQARVLIVDFKTGLPAAVHVDDLRYYALLETIRAGMPPFRVASYYLDSGTYRFDDVDVDLLRAAVRRTVEGVRKIAELHLGRRQPSVVAGPQCRWCALRHDCEEGRSWKAGTDDGSG